MSETPMKEYYVGVPAKGEAVKGLMINDRVITMATEAELSAARCGMPRINADRRGYRVAKHGSKVVGLSTFGAMPRREGGRYLHGNTTVIGKLVVEEAHQGNGLGTALIRAAEEGAIAMGYGFAVTVASPAGAATLRKCGWTVLEVGDGITWLEPETVEEVDFVQRNNIIHLLPKAVGLRDLSIDPSDDSPHVAYKLLAPGGVLKLVVSANDDTSRFITDPLGVAVLSGAEDLSNLPFSGFMLIAQAIFRQGGSQRLFELGIEWVNLNPDQANWIAGVLGVRVDILAKKLVADIEYSKGRKM